MAQAPYSTEAAVSLERRGRRRTILPDEPHPRRRVYNGGALEQETRTNVCVESTARDPFMRDWQVVLLEDCAAALTKAEPDAAVHNVRTYFGRVADAAALERAWAEAATR
jgi:hypothetical protein